MIQSFADKETEKDSIMPPNKLYEIAPPGRILREESLEGSGITQTALAKALGLTQPRVNELLQGRRRPPPRPFLWNRCAVLDELTIRRRPSDRRASHRQKDRVRSYAHGLVRLF